jgi:hypothetical protein
MHFTKTPLKLDEYDKYSVPQSYSAIVFEYLNITEIEADNAESDLGSQGYKIFHSNLYRSQQNLFNLEVIVAKMPFVF